mgnify:CR=1 FL=1
MKIIPSLIAVSLVASAAAYFAGCGKKSAENNLKTEAKGERVSDEIAALRVLLVFGLPSEQDHQCAVRGLNDRWIPGPPD